MPPFSLASLLRPDLAELTAYVPHPGSFPIRLDANESPMLLCPEARRALEQAIVPEAWNRYPDPRAVELRAAIAAHCDASPDEILVGTGSDEVIGMLLGALDRPRGRAPAATVVTPTPTFVMYRQTARTRGMRVLEVPLDAAWDLDGAAMRKAIEMGEPNLVFLAVPNNPTGALFSADRVAAVIQAASDALVILDEAYIDFSSRHHLALRHTYPNVAILRTLSKIGFASLRIGWLVGSKELVHEVDKVRQPYNIPTPSQRGGTFVLRELRGELDRIRGLVIAERERLAKGLAGLGFGITPSETNFLWVETQKPAGEVFDALAARGILVRSFHGRGGRLARRIRVTVGTPDENTRFLEEIAACA